MSVPLVSVLLPVRDGGAALGPAIDSVRAQTVVSWELVAVDDGSTDDSAAQLAAWAARDARVRVLRGPARGIAAALTTGLRACRGAFVARMDADDLAHPERLEAQLALLAERPDIAVASCLVDAVAVDGGAAGAGMARYVAWTNSLITAEAIARERFVESPVVHPTVLMPRRLLEAAGGYRDGPFPEDYDLWLRLIGAGVRFAKVPRPLLAWRDHGARATRTDPRYGDAGLRAAKVEHLLAGPLRARPPIVFWGVGHEGKPLLRALVAAQVPVLGVVDLNPRKIGQTIHGARVHPTAALRCLLATRPGARVLVAVGVPAARPEIRAELEGLGLSEGEGFFFLR